MQWTMLGCPEREPRILPGEMMGRNLRLPPGVKKIPEERRGISLEFSRGSW